MTNSDFLGKLNHTINLLDEGAPAVWSHSLAGSGAAIAALRDVLHRALLLTGTSDVLLADGALDDRNGPEGYVVLITDSHIIRATFGDFDGQRLRPAVESVPLRAVERVSVDDARPPRDDDSSWRFARVTLHLDRQVTTAREITIPRSNNPGAAKVATIADLAGLLPLG